MRDNSATFANILRALIDKAGGELLVEITNENNEPFTLAHKIEYKDDKTFVRLVVLGKNKEKLQ